MGLGFRDARVVDVVVGGVEGLQVQVAVREGGGFYGIASNLDLGKLDMKRTRIEIGDEKRIE